MMTSFEEFRTGPLRKACHGIQAVLRKTNGNATVEYALFLTLVAACGFGGAELLGLVVESGLEHMAFDESQISSSIPQRTFVGDAQHVALAAEVEEVRKQPAWLHMVLGAFGTAVGWVVWYLLRKRRKSKRPEIANDEPVAEQEIEAIAKRAFEKRQEILKILSGDWTGAAAGDIEVGKLMSRNLCTIKPNTPRAEIKALFDQQSMRHVIVVDREGAVIGIISDRDLHTRSGNKASQIMTPRPYTVAPHTAITPAITMLVNRGISCLPVVAKNKLCGILTTTDLIMALQCILQILVRQSISGSGDLYDEDLPEADLFAEHFGDPGIDPNDS